VGGRREEAWPAAIWGIVLGDMLADGFCEFFR
jgi:hypothetical protein